MPRPARKLLYLIGEPGVGKTTTMAALTSRWENLGEIADHPARTLFGQRRTGQVAAVELGRRRPGGFSGTDALPMAVITAAERHIRSGLAAAECPLMLAEGARLANRRFLGAAVEAGWQVHLAYLFGEVAAEMRRTARGSTQNPVWLAGAATRARRLADDPPAGVTVHLVRAEWKPAQRAAALAEIAGLPALTPVGR